MSDFKLLFGKKVKKIRESKNFTQEYLAELIGIEQATLSNIERGKSHPTVETLEKLSKALDVEPYIFYKFEDKKPIDKIISEISCALKQDENLAGVVYNFFLAVR